MGAKKTVDWKVGLLGSLLSSIIFVIYKLYSLINMIVIPAINTVPIWQVLLTTFVETFGVCFIAFAFYKLIEKISSTSFNVWYLSFFMGSVSSIIVSLILVWEYWVLPNSRWYIESLSSIWWEASLFRFFVTAISFVIVSFLLRRRG